MLLAAGGSARLGQPKQLLVYRGQSLLQRAIAAATSSKAHTCVVVLGARAELLQQQVDSKRVQVVVNADWQEGMAASIRCGVKALMEKAPAVQGLLLMVCDQPYVTASLLNNIMKAHQSTGQPIVTCSYAGTFGPPTLFHKSLFPELLQLKGDVGAREVIRRHADEVEVVLFPEGSLDIDSGADYQQLSKEDRE